MLTRDRQVQNTLIPEILKFMGICLMNETLAKDVHLGLMRERIQNDQNVVVVIKSTIQRYWDVLIMEG